MEFKYKRTIKLTLQSNSPQRLNKLASKLFRTRDTEEDQEKYVSINAVME